MGKMLKETTLQTAELLDMLPDEDIPIINAFTKNFILHGILISLRWLPVKERFLEKAIWKWKMEILFPNKISSRDQIWPSKFKEKIS